MRDLGKMCVHAFGRDVPLEHRIVLFVECDHGDVGRIALVSRAGVSDLAQLHGSGLQVVNRWGGPLAAARTGDTLVVPKLDRLARSVPDARAIADALVVRGVKLALGSS